MQEFCKDDCPRFAAWYESSNPINPKDAAQLRDKKPQLDLLEPEANRQIAGVMLHGADKYGRQNYLTIDIRARIYAAAVMRHAQQFLEGEDQDADSGLSHWAHIGANVHIFLAALAADRVIDDRGPAERSPLSNAWNVAEARVLEDAAVGRLHEKA